MSVCVFHVISLEVSPAECNLPPFMDMSLSEGTLTCPNPYFWLVVSSFLRGLGK
jgi:hypothetical protein